MWQLNVSLEIILEKILCNDENDRKLNYLDPAIVHVVLKNENQKNYHQTVLGVIKRLLEIKAHTSHICMWNWWYWFGKNAYWIKQCEC